MSMKDFVDTLTPEQKQALLDALADKKSEPKNINPEPQKNNNNIVEDFTMNQPSNSAYKKRKEPVKAKSNTWVDTGEAKDIITPNIQPTPRRRQPPQKISLQCHVCGKDFTADKRFVFGEFNRCDRCASKK